MQDPNRLPSTDGASSPATRGNDSFDVEAILMEVRRRRHSGRQSAEKPADETSPLPETLPTPGLAEFETPPPAELPRIRTGAAVKAEKPAAKPEPLSKPTEIPRPEPRPPVHTVSDFGAPAPDFGPAQPSPQKAAEFLPKLRSDFLRKEASRALPVSDAFALPKAERKRARPADSGSADGAFALPGGERARPDSDPFALPQAARGRGSSREGSIALAAERFERPARSPEPLFDEPPRKTDFAPPKSDAAETVQRLKANAEPVFNEPVPKTEPEPPKSIEDMILAGESLIPAGGFRRPARTAPHTLTPEELLGGSKPRPDAAPQTALSAAPSVPAKPAPAEATASVRSADFAEAAQAASAASTPAPAAETRKSESLLSERLRRPPSVNPFLLNRNMFDKTLHLEPVETESACKVFKTPTEPGPEEPAPVSPSAPRPEPTAFLRERSEPVLPSREPRPPRMTEEPARPPQSDAPRTQPAPAEPASEKPEVLEMSPADADLRRRKREAFENAKKPDRSYHVSEREIRFHSSKNAEITDAEPNDAFFITAPIPPVSGAAERRGAASDDAPRPDSQRPARGRDLFASLGRDADRAQAKIRLFDGEAEPQRPEEPPVFPDDDAEMLDDYENPEDAPVIRGDLAARKGKMWAKTLSTGIFFALSAALSLLPAAGIQLSFLSLQTRPAIFYGLQLILMLTGIAVNFSSMRGLWSLLTFRPDFDSSVASAAFFAAAHTVFLLLKPAAAAGVPSFAPAALLGFFLSDVGKLFMLLRISENFEEVANLRPKWAAFVLPDDGLAMAAAEGVTLGAPVVCVSRPTARLKGFLYHSFCEDPADALCARLAPVSYVVALAAAAATLFKGGTAAAAFGAFSAVLCVFLPAVCLVAGHRQMHAAARRALEDGAMISGFDAVGEFCDVSSLAVDAKDLFPKDKTVLHSIRTFGNMAIDRAILDCCAVAVASNSPLSDLFDKVIEGRRNLLPRVGSLDYEDGCGISGIVAGRRVLVGNRELCLRHGVTDLPDAAFEEKIFRSGKFPVYLACDGVAAAMFIVSYEADEEIAESLQKLTAAGVSILISTSDPNVSDAMVCRRFGLPAEWVRVLPADVSVRLHRHNRRTKAESALLSHNGSVIALASALYSCLRLRGNFRFLAVFQTAAAAVGALLAFRSLFFGAALWMSIPFLLALQIGSLAVANLILKFRKPY